MLTDAPEVSAGAAPRFPRGPSAVSQLPLNAGNRMYKGIPSKGPNTGRISNWRFRYNYSSVRILSFLIISLI